MYVGVVIRRLCSSFSEAHMNSGKKVTRSFHPSLHFPANFYHSLSPSFIIPPATAPSHLLSTFSHHPITLCPFPTLICLLGYISQPPPLVSLPLLSPLIFHFLTYFAIHLFLSLLSLSAGFCLLSLSLSLLFYISIASFCLLTRHMSCCAVNSSGATPGGVTGMSRSWWMCIRSICECVQHHRSGTQDEVCGGGNMSTHSPLHLSVYLGEVRFVLFRW